MSSARHICACCGHVLTCPRCTGAVGGSARTQRKAAAARANGARGGRPVTSGIDRVLAVKAAAQSGKRGAK